MELTIREYKEKDIPEMINIWNQVVEEGVAFPQEEQLNEESGKMFFHSQSFCGVAETSDGKILGLYILHPNNIGRCSHIANASYAVSSESRGLGAGEKLVRHCIKTADDLGFRILQFNAVVAANKAARHLYEKIGFTQLGIIPEGFRMKDGKYQDICPYYIKL